jgi:vacuolar-type H+-ATPase subunit I/STV1
LFRTFQAAEQCTKNFRSTIPLCWSQQLVAARILQKFDKLFPREKLFMKFAKIVFWVAGIWGFLIITPLYFMFDLIGRNDPPPITHPGFFYGFTGVALVWQVAFILIATDPVRFRPFMIPAILEKLAFFVPVLALVLQKRMHASDLIFACIDLLLGTLFVVAYLRTPKSCNTLA